MNFIAAVLETRLENQKTKASTGVGTWEALDMVSWTLSLILEVVEERYNKGKGWRQARVPVADEGKER